jgi:hypothetical protein
VAAPIPLLFGKMRCRQSGHADVLFRRDDFQEQKSRKAARQQGDLSFKGE